MSMPCNNVAWTLQSASAPAWEGMEGLAAAPTCSQRQQLANSDVDEADQVLTGKGGRWAVGGGQACCSQHKPLLTPGYPFKGQPHPDRDPP